MLHRHETFRNVVDNLRSHLNLGLFPVFAYSFPESFTEQRRLELEASIPNLRVTFIEPNFPLHLTDSDYFYSRSSIPYVKKQFPRTRKNYLAMCDFVSAPHDIPCVKDYELVLQFDDDGWLSQDISLPSHEIYTQSAYNLCTSHTFVVDTPSRRQTRLKFFEHLCLYCSIYGIIPANEQLRHAVDTVDQTLFDMLPWPSCSFNLYKTSVFQSLEWRRWHSYVKSTDGIYKYRWGDIEVITSFFYLHYPSPVLDLELHSQGLYSPKIGNQDIIHVHSSSSDRIKSSLKKILNKFS
jgi:hypothetical protein